MCATVKFGEQSSFGELKIKIGASDMLDTHVQPGESARSTGRKTTGEQSATRHDCARIAPPSTNDKSPPLSWRWRTLALRLWSYVSRGSDDPNGVSLWTLLSLGHLELDPLPLFQALVPVHVNRAVVDEDIRTAAVHGDEAEALLRVEPLNRALSHVPFSLLVQSGPTPRGPRTV